MRRLSRSIISFVRFIFCGGRLTWAFYNDEWSHLYEPVMECLIAELNRVGRWKIDGPNLRCLNKHWRDMIDSRITHIRPLGEVKFPSMSLDRLSKMSSIRHLRLDPFIPERGIFESRTRFKKRMNSLRTLTNLTELELRGFESRSVLLCSSDCFRNVTSVVFDGVSFFNKQWVLPLESSPIKELTFTGYHVQLYLNESWFYTLRSLDLSFQKARNISLESFTRLGSLTSLSISAISRQCFVLENIERLSYLTSLVSLHLVDVKMDLPLWITSLSKLESLFLGISEYEANEAIIWALMKRLPYLKSVGLMHELVNVHHFLSFYNEATNLTSLEYLSVATSDLFDISMFARLSRLHVAFKETNLNAFDVFQLPSLEECFIELYHSEDLLPDQIVILCENLFVLEMLLYGPLQILDAIVQIVSLKKLYVYYGYTVFGSDNIIIPFSKLWVLPHLKELCFIKSSSYCDIEYEDPEFLASIEKLDLLYIRDDSKPTLTSWLRPLIPQVRIVDDDQDFRNLSRIGTKRPIKEPYRCPH